MKKVIFVFLFAILIGVVGATSVLAKEPNSQKIVTIARDTIVDSDYFASGDVVTISGTVNGDVYVLAEKVTVDGVINGDLIATGGTVVISGQVAQDARVGAGELIVDGIISGSLTAGAGQIEIDDDAAIGKSVVLGAGSMRIDGSVERGATIGGGDVILNSYIGQSAKVGAGTLTLSENAKINGDLNYWSDNEATIRNLDSVSGSVAKHAAGNKDAGENARNMFGGIGILWKIVSFVSAFILGFALLKLVPVFIGDVLKTYKDKPFVSLGLGFLSLVLAPILFILLLLSVIGIPFAVFLAFGLIVILMISKIFVALFVGEYIKARFKLKISQLGVLALGLAVWGILTSLPVLGGILTFIGCLSAVGAFLVTKKSYYKMLSEKKLI